MNAAEVITTAIDAIINSDIKTAFFFLLEITMLDAPSLQDNQEISSSSSTTRGFESVIFLMLLAVR